MTDYCHIIFYCIKIKIQPFINYLQKFTSQYIDNHSNVVYNVFNKSKGSEIMEVKTSADLLRGHTDTIVLSILQKGDNYGYEIHKSIIDKLGGEYELKEATLYSSYKRLEADGYVISFWGDETLGGRRKYYRITESGKELFRQNKADWLKTQVILNKLLEG